MRQLKKLKMMCGFKYHVISDDGRIFNVLRGFEVKCPVDGQGYKQTVITENKKHFNIRVHRFVVKTFIGNIPDSCVVDHINRDRKDNRIENLRIASMELNAQNRSPYKNKTSKYLGVCFDAIRKKWVGQIRRGGKAKFLGYFFTQKEAFKKYQEADALYKIVGELN